MRLERSVYVVVLLIGLRIFASQFVYAQDKNVSSPDKWTRRLSMRFRQLSQLVMSPDGNDAAFVVREALIDGELSEFQNHIWMVSVKGGEEVQYTQGSHSCSSPAYSPDGRNITFLTTRSGKMQIWMMPVNGGEAYQITDVPEGVATYHWSACGKFIAFTMVEPHSEEEKRQKSQKQDVVFVDEDLRNCSLYRLQIEKDAKGIRPVKRLTDGTYHVASFDWAPDSRSIVIAHQATPSPNDGYYGDSNIAIVPSDSGQVRPLVGWPGTDSSPLFSSDGKMIAFSSNGGRPEPIGLRDLYIVPSKGGSPKKLADTPDRNVSIIDWSKDSKNIFVSEFIGTTRHILVVPVNGKQYKLLTNDHVVVGSAAFNNASDKMAMIIESSESPAEIYVSKVKVFKPIQLTHIHENVDRPVMSRTDVISWKSNDGMTIEGLLTYPAAYKSEQKYPLIVDIHGGPAGVFSENFTGGPDVYMLQYFAQNGYAVLRPNPRGSTGYGRIFRYANVQDWGIGDYNDIMSGVDHVIAIGVAHEDSLCVAGWSYGGYMTSVVVTKTNRFKAASMGAGLPNMISMVNSSDIPNYMVAHMGGEVFDNFERYERHSAIYQIKNVVTPTQIIHGQQDFRVPFTQGLELFRGLKRMGVSTEMIAYPRTPHWPREPKFMMDAPYRILKWFETHLRGRSFTENAF
ncbi:S9 family peptidase [bacterium]|nr:S9 family peptidase [bacterium]